MPQNSGGALPGFVYPGGKMGLAVATSEGGHHTKKQYQDDENVPEAVSGLAKVMYQR